VDGLQAGDLDLAILSLPLSIPDIVCSELFREQILLAIPPNHRLAQLKAVALRELRQEKLLMLREGHCFRDNALAACRKARITPNAVFESDQFASIFCTRCGRRRRESRSGHGRGRRQRLFSPAGRTRKFAAHRLRARAPQVQAVRAKGVHRVAQAIGSAAAAEKAADS
jgi:DNA-binding transcriptional LysR family regulator